MHFRIKKSNRLSMKSIQLTLCLILTSTILLSGCSVVNFEALVGQTTAPSELPSEETTATTIGETEKPFAPPDPTQTDMIIEPSSGDEIVEDNINAESLEEDEKLTEDAIAAGNMDNVAIIPNEVELEFPELELIEVLRHFNTRIPDSVVENLQYSEYHVAKDYILITASAANIREKPNAASERIGRASYFEKLTVLSEVQGQYVENYQTDVWFEVMHVQGEETVYGYILSSLATLRTFQFEKMIEFVEVLKAEVDSNVTAYISNYKNWTGVAPIHNGSTVDDFGVKRYQSAPAYFEPSTQSDFRYMADGTLLSVVAETDNFFKVRTLNFEGNFFIPKKYVSLRNSIDQLTKVIVVDRNNQNEGVFEYVDNQWQLISYIYATTGEKAEFKEPTDLGHYMAIQKVDRFLYLDDVTRQITGYAPYGIRFGGGAYIHGVPVDMVTVNGVKVHAPMKEYLYTIGTMPRSHKCIRNYTSHAKFLHEWCEVGQTAIIVIE